MLEQLYIWSTDGAPAAASNDCHGSPSLPAEDIVLPDVMDKGEILRLMTEVRLLCRERLEATR